MHRIRSWAKAHATNRHGADQQAPVLPLTKPSAVSQSVNSKDGAADVNANASRSAAAAQSQRDKTSSTGAEIATNNATATSPPNNAKATGEKSATVETERPEKKPPIPTRMRNGMKRFGNHTVRAVCSSWINVLLVFVPIGIAMEFSHASPAIIFSTNAVAVVPLAGLLSHATESVAARLGDTLGALLNVSFGNAVELIIFIIAIVKNEIAVTQAAILGSILANLLLILGMAFLLGGLRFQEQIYNNTITQMSACLLSLSVMSLLLPTAFHATFNDNDDADRATLKISRGTSVILLLVYVLYLLFQLKSHSYLYESMPQQVIDEESHPGVLHDVLGTSSSSSSSESSSSSDTDSTSGSHTTAKRIKKAFHRKRRKSSASSKDSPSFPASLVSSPSAENHRGFPDASGSGGLTSTRHASVLNDIVSGDEADTDVNPKRDANKPHIRDFDKDAGGFSHSPERMEKRQRKKKNHRKKHSRHARDGENKGEDAEKASVDNHNLAQSANQARVGFADDVHESSSQHYPGSRLPFGTRRTGGGAAFRPTLPKMLSQNVFTQPPQNAPPSVTPQTSHPQASSLRRTNSLPDRLNRPQQATAARSEPMRPFVARIEAPRKVDAGDDEEPEELMSRTAAVIMLLVTTGLVALCAEFLVDAIPEMVAHSSAVSQAFIGLIILPIVGNAAEHVTAVTVAAKNKMDLAIGVAVGSSIQIALLITPIVVILGWCMNKDMSLYFNLFETISLFVTAFVVNFLVLDGRSNYLEGALLIAAYVIIAVAAFFYPDSQNQSALGGQPPQPSGNATAAHAVERAVAIATGIFTG